MIKRKEVKTFANFFIAISGTLGEIREYNGDEEYLTYDAEFQPDSQLIDNLEVACTTAINYARKYDVARIHIDEKQFLEVKPRLSPRFHKMFSVRAPPHYPKILRKMYLIFDKQSSYLMNLILQT